jgi:hypothetical protein
VNYVDAGYTIAFVTVFVYAIALGLRRRRWERALNVAREAEEPVVPGTRL